MMSSPPSSSDTASSSFELLATPVQRWIHTQGWTDLRDAQEAAIPAILAGDTDVLIAAATASGKTEAAFLPICSALVAQPGTDGVEVLYLSPLKALINDQYTRLEGLCEHLDIPVTRWHGDVSGTAKKRLLSNPRGALLMTPESLEAMFVLRGPQIRTLFAGLRYVVVDELHSFLGSERGAQLRSLLHRLELALRRRIPRIGLSATLGDMGLAAEQLRPGGGDTVQTIISAEGGQELAMQLRGYVREQPKLPAPTDDGPVRDEDSAVERQITTHLYKHLRGQTNLVFANARGNVELYAARLAEMGEDHRVPNEFWPHHGSLAKELREETEAALKDPSRPATAVCTTTLEMGIDIGSVSSISQIGPPPSVASLRQRLGRSGRRGEPAVLRGYVIEPSVDERTPLPDALRAQLFQSVAMTELLLEGWCEPPEPAALHLSTLTQQLLSLIAQHGGVMPAQAYKALCSGSSPFQAVDKTVFADLLRELGTRDVLVQSVDGTLLPGTRGEQTINHYSFYTAFITPEEFRLVHRGRHLGTVPIDSPLYDGALLIFGGKRWRVLSVDLSNKIVELDRAGGGRPPTFTGGGASVHDRVRVKMRELYESDIVPAYLDRVGRDLLDQGRATYAQHELDNVYAVRDGQDTYLLPWAGDKILNTLAVWLATEGLAVTRDGLCLGVEGVLPAQTLHAVEALLKKPVPSAVALAQTVVNKVQEKYDVWLGDDLLALDYAARSLDVPGARGKLVRMLG
jgi:ATP-dependent Lhr-like helicase